ncbi:MAG: TrkH family potassium uptake protein [Gammaproteobacteria bacterium]
MIDYRTISWIIGAFMAALAALMLTPLVFAAGQDTIVIGAFLKGAGVTLGAAALLLLIGFRRPRQEMRPREAMLLVVLVWVMTCLLGALPLWFTPHYPAFTDALFESTSGFTTTGASVIDDVEALSRPVHLWRSLSHWLGGMGIILLGLAVLPLLGHGGNAMYRAEFSGSSSERLRPRILETARSLWRIYLLLTVLEFLLLMFAGMGAFEALCHAFSTLGTGGFSTRNASIAGFQSETIEYIVILFMLLGGISFAQHYRLLVERRPRPVMRDYEVRSYLAITAVATLVIALSLLVSSDAGFEPALRAALFQTVSIATTTGFATADYTLWQPFAQLVLLVLMFVGGCTGSTASGLKVARIIFLLKLVQREFRRFTEPLGVFRIRMQGSVIPDQAICGLLNLVFLSLLLMLVASLLLTAMGMDLLTAISSVMASQFNVGPGLGEVGPTSSYGDLPMPAKWVLIFCMIAGRLEFYTFLVVLTPVFWRR